MEIQSLFSRDVNHIGEEWPNLQCWRIRRKLLNPYPEAGKFQNLTSSSLPTATFLVKFCMKIRSVVFKLSC